MNKVTKILRTASVHICGALLLLPWKLLKLAFYGLPLHVYRKYRQNRRNKRAMQAIEWAEKLADKTGYRYMVLRINGKYVVKPKQVWKQMCKCNGKYFTKGTTIQDLENKAVFITK